MNATQPYVPVPRVDVDPRLEEANIFAAVFGSLTPEEWMELLARSIDERVIDGVEFPGFPPPEFQSQIHGHYGRQSLFEAAEFYKFVKSHGLTGSKAQWFGKGHLLDFGAGWGRITRMFLRDFPLRHIVGYEPSNRFCSVARSKNPFVSFLSGGYLPDGMIPNARFDLVVGWSVFSHLSRQSARAWLAELQRVTRPGAAIVMTTWGRRFLDRLQREKTMIEAGEEIHWYSKFCLNASGDLNARIEEYERGEFVWFTGHQSELYGEAFISEGALRSLLAECAPKLSLSVFDKNTLVQDVFVLHHTG